MSTTSVTGSTTQPTLVSVVIGCYNTEPAYLVEALDSVLAQTYPHVEVIVVDDGSTLRGTREVLASYSDRVRIVRQENAGVAAARNAGVEVAQGELIQVFDSDDRMGPELIAQGVEVLTDPAVEIAFSSAKVFGEQDYLFEAGTEYRLADLMETNYITVCAMVRRDRWMSVGGQWESLRDGFEDYEFWIRILRDGGVARRTPSALFEYRVRPGSRTSLITTGARDRTREVILEANAGHLDVLLIASFDAMVRLHNERREYAQYVKQWQRRMKPLILARDLMRRASASTRAGRRR